MFVTIINDCVDANAFGRQLTRAAALFDCPVVPVPVKDDREAAGNLVDMLDAGKEHEGVILVNVAPRHGKAKKWPNGTPFGYFYLNKQLVVTTVDGYTLSLVKKLSLVGQLHLLDIPTVLTTLTKEKILSARERDHIITTQFRSFEFSPKVAYWLTQQRTLPSTAYSLDEVLDLPASIWFVDNFGNCKTTLLPTEVQFEAGKRVDTPLGSFPCFERLKDVPDDVLALVIGSSGYGERRFLELVRQGHSAWEHLPS